MRSVLGCVTYAIDTFAVNLLIDLPTNYGFQEVGKHLNVFNVSSFKRKATRKLIKGSWQ